MKIKHIKTHDIVLYLVLLLLLLLPFFNAFGLMIYLRNENAVVSGFTAYDAFTYALKQTLADSSIMDIANSPFYSNINSFLTFFGFKETMTQLITYWFSIFGGWLVLKIVIVLVERITNLLNRNKD